MKAIKESSDAYESIRAAANEEHFMVIKAMENFLNYKIVGMAPMIPDRLPPHYFMYIQLNDNPKKYSVMMSEKQSIINSVKNEFRKNSVPTLV